MRARAIKDLQIVYRYDMSRKKGRVIYTAGFYTNADPSPPSDRCGERLNHQFPFMLR